MAELVGAPRRYEIEKSASRVELGTWLKEEAKEAVQVRTFRSPALSNLLSLLCLA